MILGTWWNILASNQDYPINHIDKVEDHAGARLDEEEHCTKYKVFIINIMSRRRIIIAIFK